MKICCVIYHSNIYELYKKQWLIDFLHSIHSQTFQNFDIIECCYDNSNIKLIESLKEYNLFNDKKYIYLNKKYKNNIECQNFLFKHIFEKLNYEICINTNIDDIYHEKRFELQIEKIKNGYDLVSSNYKIFQEYKNNKYERKIDIIKNNDISNDYKKRLFITKLILEKKLNIPFSATTFTKKCWLLSNRNLEYPETLYLCNSILEKKIKVDLNSEFLLEHRIHNNQFSNIYKDKII